MNKKVLFITIAITGCLFSTGLPDESGRGITQILIQNALKDSSCANFFWHGHGFKNEITPDPKPTRSNTLLAGQVGTMLRNNTWWGVASHPYRLVILDACNSFSAGWADAFGIPRTQTTQAEYMRNGRDAQAFVGWPLELPLWNPVLNTWEDENVLLSCGPAGPDYGAVMEAWGNAEGLLQSLWMLGYPLTYCLQQFNASLVNWGMPFSWNPSAVEVLNPIWYRYGKSNLCDPYGYYQIYGCYDLTSISDE